MINVEGLYKHFKLERTGTVGAVRHISFDVSEGAMFTLLGPSGCGKTTTLRCIAGLERPEEGKISIANQVVVWAEKHYYVPPERRQIGMVFQSYAIWPHMTVYQNVAYALQNKGLSRSQIKQRVAEVLDLVELGNLADRPAPNLSGGQQQRVALARALVAKPKVLLLDEPLSNLDAKLRQQMRVELRKVQREMGVTALYVTHDQEEALSLADEIAVMLQGEIVELGKPQEIYQRPKRQFTADFLGFANFLKGEVVEKGSGATLVRVAGGFVQSKSADAEVGHNVTAFFRPENITFLGQKPAHAECLVGTVLDLLFLGEVVDCHLRIGSSEKIRIRSHPRHAPRVGEQVFLTVDPEFCTLLPAEA